MKTLKEYLIKKNIEKLEEMKNEERKVYLCDLDCELWESERLDGTITYNTYEAKEWIKNYFNDIGEVWEEVQFSFDKEFLQDFNMFDNPEKFMLLIVCEASNYLLNQCQYINDNWNEQKVLNDSIIKKIIDQLKKLNNGGCIYE